MTWRAIADRLDADVVHTFDEGGVQLQKMAAGAPQGAPIPIPAEFDGAYVDQSIQDGQLVSTTRPMAWLHYDDLTAAGTAVAVADRLVLTTGPNAGTYTVDSLEPNSDNTGATVRLRRSRTT